MTPWFTDAEKVTHTFTAADSALLWKALDRYGRSYESGPTRTSIDNLAKKISNDQARAHFAAQGNAEIPNDTPLGFAFNRSLADGAADASADATDRRAA